MSGYESYPRGGTGVVLDTTVIPSVTPDVPCLCVNPCSVILFTAGVVKKLKWLFAWPLSLLFYFTIPNSGSPRWENYFMMSFASSTMWIAGLSYIMVWMVSSRTIHYIKTVLVLMLGGHVQ